ncbi:hypothetical protein Salat_2256300 [Sesamum alatum]|uniref:Uncharacterized protein n=1 Tax=Sesamum alatum TaxID=300844 RepID=A0AAE1XUX9_9LAMI|nr:hypothetical protein Salat_2256300 [Sesamum alatum]
MYTKGGGKALNIAVYYCLPGLSLDNGIRPLNGDDGIRELLRAYRGLEVIPIYIEEKQGPLLVIDTQGNILPTDEQIPSLPFHNQPETNVQTEPEAATETYQFEPDFSTENDQFHPHSVSENDQYHPHPETENEQFNLHPETENLQEHEIPHEPEYAPENRPEQTPEIPHEPEQTHETCRPQDTRNDFSRPSDSRNDIGTDNNNARPSDSRNEHNPETDTQTEDISLFSDDHAFEAPAQSSQTTTDQMAQNMSQTASNTVDILPPRLVTSMSAFTQPMRSAERQTFTQPMRTAQRQAFTQPMRTAQRPLSSAILQRLRRPNQHGSRPVFFTQRPSNQQQREVTTQFRSPFEVPPQCNNNAQAPPSLQKGPHRKCQEEESKWFQFPEHPNYRSALKVQVVHFKEDVAQQTNKQLCKHY